MRAVESAVLADKRNTKLKLGCVPLLLRERDTYLRRIQKNDRWLFAIRLVSLYLHTIGTIRINPNVYFALRWDNGEQLALR